MSKAYDKIYALLEAAGENPDNEFELEKEIMRIWKEDGSPEDCKEQFGLAAGYVGRSYYYGWDMEERDLEASFEPFLEAYNAGNMDILEELGMCYFNGWGTEPDEIRASILWKKGMDLGDKACALHRYVWEVENDRADESTIAGLTDLVNDPEEPSGDATAVLYTYYWNIGDKANAALWCQKGLEMGSELMKELAEEDAEEENDGGKYVIIADVNDEFRIVQADASDWRSLPALIGAERCDDMRCEKFRQVSAELGLPGTLLGQLDRDAFRKPDLEPNWHASQWYDGMADLMGDMVICLEDSKYNPFSFSSKSEAQKVIDALCR